MKFFIKIPANWICIWFFFDKENLTNELIRIFQAYCNTVIVILIVEFAKALREEGMGLVEATVAAAKLRLRPILMTSLAFTCGVIPLVIASGASSETQKAIGTGVFGGMISATVLAVIFVPIFFIVVMSMVEKFSKRKAAH